MTLNGADHFVFTAAPPVKECLRANETFSSFLLTNTSLSPATVDQLKNARLNFQVQTLFMKLKKESNS